MNICDLLIVYGASLFHDHYWVTHKNGYLRHNYAWYDAAIVLIYIDAYNLTHKNHMLLMALLDML